MTQLTVRRVEEAWVAKAKAIAAERGVSMNTILVEVLRQSFGGEDSPKTNGLEQFAGCMPFESDEERKQWDESMKVFDQIDEELWK